MAYLRRTYRLPAELEEALVADLWLLGTLGVSTESEAGGQVRLTAWFAPVPPPAPAGLPERVECLGEEELPDTDWMAEYRRLAVPFAVGRTLVVDPREPAAVEAEDAKEEDGAAAAVPAGRRLLRLPARNAFGVGSHESTRLALALLEATDLSGRAVLDVGTGTGILAFAALALWAARVVAFDADPAAAFQARANSRLNGLGPRLFAGRPAALSRHLPAGARFDLAVVNVVPEEILPELACLLPALAPAGALILSGLLAARAAEVRERLEATALGLAETARRQDGEWLALRLERTPL